MITILKKIYKTSPQLIYRYFANERRLSKTRQLILKYVASHDTRKLHIGCGGNFLEGWLNSDLVPDSDKFALLDASKTFPVSSDTFDYVYSEHVFEHLNFEQQLNYLRESLRILKPGGKIRIATPNFDFLAHLAGKDRSAFEREYLEWNFATFLKNIPVKLKDPENLEVYVINNYFRDWGHQLIHNKSSINKLIEYAGFQVVGFENVNNSTDPVLQGLEHHGAMITDTYNKFETMVIEATKPMV
jgi:SAM-dependent methyltransferase